LESPREFKEEACRVLLLRNTAAGNWMQLGPLDLRRLMGRFLCPARVVNHYF
jgi:hypothetical protein